MRVSYLGQVEVKEAIRLQTPGTVLGFEPLKPVITLGRRGHVDLDVLNAPPQTEILTVDRGGQATLHNPGQLVIFPCLDVRELGGAKAWVELLVRTSLLVAAGLGRPLRFDPKSPGLYEQNGQAKVISLGVRLRQGISTHGLAINVRNDLNEFEWIRSCGQAQAPMAHLVTNHTLLNLFEIWCQCFQAKVDKSSKLVEFMSRSNTEGSVGAVGSAFP